MAAKSPNQTASLIFIRGLPGSGKSYFAKRLARRLGDQAVLLDPDKVDQTSDDYKQHVKSQIAEGVDPKLHLYRYSRAQAFEAIKAGKIVLWNQPFSNTEIFNKVTDRFRSYATENNIELSVFIVEVNTDPEVAKTRVEARKARGGHGPSESTFARFMHDFTSFRGQGYPVITIDGEAPAGQSVNKILSELAMI